MSLQSLQSPSGSPQSLSLPVTEAKKPAGELPFADLVKGLVQDTNRQQAQSEDGVRQLVTGETDSIHEVVLTTSRADLAFRLMMEIRNRLIASYQEVMRMQV